MAQDGSLGRLLGSLLFAGSLAGSASEAAVARSGQVVMGTVLTVTVVAADDATARSLADAAIAEVRRWDDALTIWRPDGELARLNAAAGRGAVPVGTRLEEGLEAMLRFARETGGAFDPAIGAIVREGIRAPAHSRAREQHPVPAIGLVLRVSEHSASLNAGSSLDPGAIGKGLALDAAAKLLREGGAEAAFLDFGGSSQLALGAPPSDPGGWTVAISGWSEGSVHGTLKLRDQSLSTSRAGAADTTPILDPRSGAVVSAPRLVTVLTRDATSADAWSTALVVFGRDGLAAAVARSVEALLEDDAGTARTGGFPLQP